MSLNHKGEGKGGAILGFAVFLLLVYLAWTIVPVMIRVYAFEDQINEECKFLHGRSLDKLKEDIVESAVENELPVELEDIQASKRQDELHEQLRLRVQYTVPITTPFYVYNWQRDFVYDAPSFE